MICFATYAANPDFAQDDKQTAEILTRSGKDVCAVAWDDSTVDWKSFELIVIRSTWDYYKKPEAFNRWLEELEHSGANVLNPVRTLKWNAHKSYLRDLQLSGAQLLPTVWLERGSRSDIKQIISEQGWDEAVVKPLVSADAQDTYRTSSPDFSPEVFEQLLQNKDMMVQEFSPELVRDGELSLTFFNRHYSHATLKTPHPDDFRTQEHYSPRYEGTEVGASVTQQAQEILNTVEGDLLYSRVDGILRNGVFHLLELELLEPTLYMAYSPEASNKFAEAILYCIPS